MVRRWSKPEMWVPGGYLALVLAMVVYMEVGSRVGDVGFFGVYPILATAPVSLLLLGAFAPAPDTLDETAPVGPEYYGSEPPARLPTDYPDPSDPLPADWVAPDTSVSDKLGMWGDVGFVAAILVGALINATALWALLRYVARRARS